MPSAISLARNKVRAEGARPPQAGLGSLSPWAPLTQVAHSGGGPLALSTEKAVGLPELRCGRSPRDIGPASLVPFVAPVRQRGVRQPLWSGQGYTWSSEAHSATCWQGRGLPAPTSGKGDGRALGLGSWLLRWWRWGLGQSRKSLGHQRSWGQALWTCCCAPGASGPWPQPF